jgi:ATP-dependent Lhr-like helicase
MTPEAYRDALPRLYGPLVARHGRPSPIQLAAAPPLLDGRDVLLCAPTASGKTEAWLVPIGERHLPPVRAGAGIDDRPRVLVVSPTRALVNDLHRRLEPRLASAGIAIGRWTGDHHDGGRMHAVTLLTPEGLDSRLARAPAALEGVSAVVIDEIHVLDSTARGDQLRVLLERMRALVSGPLASGALASGARVSGEGVSLQVVGASATVGDPAALAARYLRDPVVVRAGVPRKVLGRIEQIADPEHIVRCLQDACGSASGGTGLRKVLLFCNARNEVEALAKLLRGHPPFGEAVFAHHGSLARSVRLGVERRFQETPTALCVATSTLEMGVDIGDVDLVALKGLPPSTASLLQRVGRGGRRGSASNVLAFVESAFEARALRTLLAAGGRDEWLEGPYGFRSGVLVQQAVSVLHERRSRTVDAGALHRRLPPALALAWPPDRIEGVLAHAEAKGWLARRIGGDGGRGGGRAWAIGPKAEGAWARGALHANLSQQVDVAVFDALTGEEVGRVATPEGPTVQLGGRGRRALRAEQARVVTESADTSAEARFAPSPAAAVPGVMARALLGAIGVAAPCRVELPIGRVLFHGLGTAGGAVLAGCWPKGSLRSAGPLAVVFAEWPAQWPDPTAATASLGRLHRSIGRSLGMGAFHAALPEEEQLAAVRGLCEMDRVEALVRAGMPALAPADQPELWGEAADW